MRLTTVLSISAIGIASANAWAITGYSDNACQQKVFWIENVHRGECQKTDEEVHAFKLDEEGQPEDLHVYGFYNENCSGPRTLLKMHNVCDQAGEAGPYLSLQFV